MTQAVTAIVRLAPEWEQPETRGFCSALESTSRQVPPEAVIHEGRNLIFRQRVGGGEVAIKRFPVSGFRRLVYRFRTSKAVRAFDHAARLVAMGIGTPRPLAAVEVRRGGALLASFYCCRLVPTVGEARLLKHADAPRRAELVALLGEFIGGLHESGVLHRDLTSGNVLLVPDGASPVGVAFHLVDLNRMRFGRVGVQAGLANLAQLRLGDEGLLLEAYCRARGLGVARARPYYRIRRKLRTLRQTVKERTRPVRRRLGLRGGLPAGQAEDRVAATERGRQVDPSFHREAALLTEVGHPPLFAPVRGDLGQHSEARRARQTPQELDRVRDPRRGEVGAEVKHADEGVRQVTATTTSGQRLRSSEP